MAAALIQALFHGLDVQLMIDPDAFDRAEMFAACLRSVRTACSTELRSDPDPAPGVRR